MTPEYTLTKHDTAELAVHSIDLILQSQTMAEAYGCRLTQYTKTPREIQKLAHVFQGIGLIVFVIDLASYNEQDEDGGETCQNKMLQNIACLEFIVKLPCLRGVMVMILLGNYAEFEQRLLTTSFAEAFPDYKGGPDPDLAILHLLLQLYTVGIRPQIGGTLQPLITSIKPRQMLQNMWSRVEVMRGDNIADMRMVLDSIEHMTCQKLLGTGMAF